jgi:hypothetical protein
MGGLSRIFRSRVHVAGAAVGATGILLHVAGVIGGSLWWIAVVVLYGVGASIGVWSESLRDAHQQHVIEEGLDTEAIRQALTNQFRSINGRVPAVVMMRFLQIRKTINELLPRARELPPGSMELFTLQQTALDYLPGALRTYLALPPAYATAHAVDGSRTPLQVLTDELTLLATNVDKVAETVRKQDTDRLLIHRRFLEDRFRGGLNPHKGEGEILPGDRLLP